MNNHCCYIKFDPDYVREFTIIFIFLHGQIIILISFVIVALNRTYNCWLAYKLTKPESKKSTDFKAYKYIFYEIIYLTKSIF